MATIQDRLDAFLKSGELKIKDGAWVGMYRPMVQIGQDRRKNDVGSKEEAKKDIRDGGPVVQLFTVKQMATAKTYGWKEVPVPTGAPKGAKKSTKKTEA